MRVFRRVESGPSKSIFLCFLVSILLGSCQSQSVRDGSQNYDSSSTGDRVAVALSCQDGAFWGQCLLTWSDGSQESACNGGLFGCTPIGEKTGNVVDQVTFINNLGQTQCLKLDEGGWIEDCFNPMSWLPDGGSGTSTSPNDASSDENSSSGYQQDEDLETSTTTTQLLPPTFAVRYKDWLGWPLTSVCLSNAQCTPRSYATLYFDIELVNSNLAKACFTLLGNVLGRLSTKSEWDGLGNNSKPFGNTGCTAGGAGSVQNTKTDLSYNLEFEIYFYPEWPNENYFAKDVPTECVVKSQQVCRSYQLSLEFIGNSGQSVIKNFRLDLIARKSTEAYVHFTEI